MSSHPCSVSRLTMRADGVPRTTSKMTSQVSAPAVTSSAAWSMTRSAPIARSIASSQLKAGSASYTGKSAVLAPNSGAELADFLGVDEVIVARARYTSAASTKTKILNNTVLMYFAEQGQMMDDPSNVKRFVSECEGGGYLRVYLQNTNAKFLKLTVEHYSDIVIPTTKGLYKSAIT